MTRDNPVAQRRLAAAVLTIVWVALGGCSSDGGSGAGDTAAARPAVARESAVDRIPAPALRDNGPPPAGSSAPRQAPPSQDPEGQRRTDGSPRNPPLHRTTPRDDDVLNPPPGGAPGAAPGDLMAQVRALAKTSGCTAAGDCRALPVGRKACGGPRAYVVYCPASTNESALRAKIAEFDRADMEASRGAMSDCMLVTEPEITVSGGQCRASGGASGGGNPE